MAPVTKKTKTWTRSAWMCLVLVCVTWAVGCAPEQEVIDPDESITVGLLLPFTGSSAATASNFEKAVIMAADRVNDAGGIQGKLIRVVARDTHSEVDRSVDSVEDLIDEDAAVVIGPESPEIAAAIRERLGDVSVPLVSPLIGEGEEVTLDCSRPWYRLAPSAQALGESLANDLAGEGYSEIAILYGSGEYNTAFRRAVREKFEGSVLGGTVVVERALEEDASSYARDIEDVLAEDPEAIVLSTSPQMGAVVFTEASLLGAAHQTWALSPLLKTPLFLQNIDAGAAEGAVGIAPKIFDESGEFPEAFADRWLGDTPLEGAYFYFDAVNLLTIAFGLLDDVEDYEYAELTDAIVQASSSQGVSVGWDEVDGGLDRMERGTDVHYSGLTGPILLRECGDRRSGVSEAWTIEDGKIEEPEP